MQPSEDPALALLLEMEEAVQGHEALAREWEEALEGFARGADTPAVRARFREWFLLERDSVCLGSPPVVAWAPESLEADSPWTRLLDSFLGIFRLKGATEGGGIALEDLWSGREILTRSLSEADFADAEALAVGRFVQEDPFVHRPLPGLLIVAVPGLMPALERDLERIRSERRRSRLSQLEIERLLGPFRSGGEAAPLAEELRPRVREALAGQAEWDLDRVEAALLEDGSTETLNRLAFDTALDLEPLRRLLPALEQALRRRAEDPGASGDTPACAPERARAVARFEEGLASGRPLEGLFEELESAFGLERGSTREGSPSDGAVEAPPPPPFRTWLESYFWEAEVQGRAPTRWEKRALEELAGFLASTVGERFDIRQLGDAQVLAFLLRSENAEVLRERRMALEAFLEWAAVEQEAPLETLLREDPARDRRMEAVVDLNARLRKEGREGAVRARVAALDPPQVEGQGSGLAPLEGLTVEESGCVRAGDLLLGRWEQGRFQVAGVLPAEVLPGT